MTVKNPDMTQRPGTRMSEMILLLECALNDVIFQMPAMTMGSTRKAALNPPQDSS